MAKSVNIATISTRIANLLAKNGFVLEAKNFSEASRIAKATGLKVINYDHGVYLIVKPDAVLTKDYQTYRLDDYIQGRTKTSTKLKPQDYRDVRHLWQAHHLLKASKLWATCSEKEDVRLREGVFALVVNPGEELNIPIDSGINVEDFFVSVGLSDPLGPAPSYDDETEEKEWGFGYNGCDLRWSDESPDNAIFEGICQEMCSGSIIAQFTYIRVMSIGPIEKPGAEIYATGEIIMFQANGRSKPRKIVLGDDGNAAAVVNFKKEAIEYENEKGEKKVIRPRNINRLITYIAKAVEKGEKREDL